MPSSIFKPSEERLASRQSYALESDLVLRWDARVDHGLTSLYPSRLTGAVFLNCGGNATPGNVTLPYGNKLRCFVEKITEPEFRKTVSAEQSPNHCL